MSIHIRCNRWAAGVVVFFLSLAVTGQAFAQTRPGYETALLEYGQVTKVNDSQKMAEFMHPEGLRRFRSVMDAAFHGPKSEDAARALLPLFSVSSIAEFARLTDVEAFKRMNDAVKKAAPELADMMSTATYEIVGSVVKGDVAYVTYTLGFTMEGKAVKSEVVQTLKMHDGKWLLLLPSTAEASIARIQARFH